MPSAPLYDLFCRTTGFGGTPVVAQAGDRPILDRTVNVRFDSNVDTSLPWKFQPLQREVKVRLGEEHLAYYRVTNLSQRPAVGTSTYNVTPETCRRVVQQAPVLLLHRAVAAARAVRGHARGLLRRSRVGQGSALRQHPDHHALVHILRGEDGTGQDLARQRGRQRYRKGWMNMAGGTPKHPYHLVDPSPWPALGSLAALILALGFALALHPNMLGPGVESVMKSVHWWALAPGLLLVVGVMYWWWSDVIAESRVYHTSVVQLGLRYGMILFIASEVLFFAAFFWAFFDAALYPGAPNMPVRAEATGGIWPPKGISIIAPFDLPLMNTLILLLSGTTATWAHHAIIEGNQKDAVRGLLCTVLLGADLHRRPGLRVHPRAVHVQPGHLYVDLLHGDGLPRLPRAGRHDLPDRLPDPRREGPVQAQAAFRLRGRCLVLALRRRGLAVPVLLHLLVGRGQGADRPALRHGTGTILGTAGCSPAVRLWETSACPTGRANRRSTSPCAAPARAAARAGCSPAC